MQFEMKGVLCGVAYQHRGKRSLVKSKTFKKIIESFVCLFVGKRHKLSCLWLVTIFFPLFQVVNVHRG